MKIAIFVRRFATPLLITGLVVTLATQAHASPVKILRYLVTSVKLYDANGHFFKTVQVSELQQPNSAAPLISDYDENRNLLSVTYNNATYYISEGAAQSTIGICPSDQEMKALPTKMKIAGDTAGANEAKYQCLPK